MAISTGKLVQVLAACAGVGICGVVVALLSQGDGLDDGAEPGIRAGDGAAVDGGDSADVLSGLSEKSDRAMEQDGQDVSRGSTVWQAEPPDTFASVFDRLVAAGLISEYSAELMQLMGGQELAVDPPIDIYSLMDRVRGARNAKELAAVLNPLVKALREINKSKDPALEDDRKKLALALMVAGQDVTYAENLTAEQRLDALWQIAGALGPAKIPEFSLALADLATAVDAQGLSERGKRLEEGIARTRVDAMLVLRDLQGYNDATATWMAMAADQKPGAEAARIRTYATRLMTFTPSEVAGQGGASWPGVSQLSAEAISKLGTGWLRPSKGADADRLAMVRTSLVKQLDAEIATRTAAGAAASDIALLRTYRDAAAAATTPRETRR